jgi:cytosylglucuronate decarboxylase
LRDARRCFARAVEGLAGAVSAGLKTRVNTVVGPHNYREMPDLQRLIADIGVHQWELSALKLSHMPRYDDIADVMRVGERIYVDGPLRPLGKRWYGETDEERRRYFEEGVPPRATGPYCHAATDVIYLDARNSAVYVCSCLPHRPQQQGRPVPVEIGVRPEHELFGAELRGQQEYFRVNGPRSCTGCSSAAAGYSDVVDAAAMDAAVDAWSY